MEPSSHQFVYAGYIYDFISKYKCDQTQIQIFTVYWLIITSALAQLNG